MKEFSISPAILTINDTVAQTQLAMANSFPDCQVVQIDVIDGWFADNITISPLDFPYLEFGSVSIDVHLMVEEPLDFVYELVSVKESAPVRAVIIQAERVHNPGVVIEEIRQQDWLPGISIDQGTDIEELIQDLEDFLPFLKIWQVMGIKAGFQGQTFVPSTITSIEWMVQTLGNQQDVEILVDGGINPKSIESARLAGATGAAVGSFLWKSDNPLARWEEIRAAAMHSV